ncbi:MAG: manganese efflux pump [Erysipelotrichales bacterium]|nr:manganese efflux pump [Erysipelotrichales bacterium]
MLEAGATTRNLCLRDVFTHSLIFGVTSSLMFSLGLNLGDSIFSNGLELLHKFVSSMTLFIICFSIIYSTLKKPNFIEKYNANFNYKVSLRFALLSSFDVFSMGISLSSFNFEYHKLILLMFIVTFIAVFIALLVGYYQGAAYQKSIGFCGALIYFIIANYQLYIYFFS